MARPSNSSDRGTVAPAYRDGNSGQNNNAFGFYTAKVMNNIDALKLNRVQIHVPAFGAVETDSKSWLTARPMSPHGGTTPNPGSNEQDFDKVQKAYGTFTPAPDIGSTVTVAFLDGNVNQPVIVGSLFQDNLIHSLPGIGTGKYKDKDGNVVEGPVTEHNHTTESDQPTERVRHRTLDDAIKKQGLDNDPYRGPSTSSSQRESPSRVHGTLTRGQQQFVMDDGDSDGNNRLIRLRTRNGAQVLLSDSCGFVYIISKDGNSWLELANDGSVSIYGADNINIHSGKDLNLVAQGAVNIEGNDVNIKSRTADIRMESKMDFHATSHNNMFHYSEKNADLLVKGNYKETAQKIDMNGPKAEEAKQPLLHDLSVNSGFRQSIASAAPEAEPWGGHAGCGDGTNKNPSLDTDQTEAAGVPESAGQQVGNNTASALPPGQQTTLPGSMSGMPGVSAIGGQTQTGSLGSVLGSAAQLPTGIGTQGVLGVLGAAVANVLGVPSTGFLGNPKAQAQSNPDRYGEYPSPPISRSKPPTGGGFLRDGSGNIVNDGQGNPVRAGSTQGGTGESTTQPSASGNRTEAAPPRPADDKSCEKGPSTPATSLDEYGCLMICCFELYRGTPYKDGNQGYASIGYGRLLAEKSEPFLAQAHNEGQGGITEEEAWAGLQRYKSTYEAGVNRLSGGRPIPQNVFNGICSFLYQNGQNRTTANGQDLKQLISDGNWGRVAQAIQGHGGDRHRRSLEAQLIVNGCYPFHIVSKGSARIREEKTLEGIRALGGATRSPGGVNGNRGYSFATHGNSPRTTPNQITQNQATRLLRIYAGDPRPAVADAAKRLMGGGQG